MRPPAGRRAPDPAETEASLLARAQAGDVSAFEHLSGAYADRLFMLLLLRLPGVPPSPALRRRAQRRPLTPELRTVEEAIAWLGTERANLHACAGYAAAHGCLVHAVRIPAAMSGFLHTQGHWNEAVILGQAWTLNQLGVVQMLTGDYPAAASLTRALELSRDTWATGTARLGPSTSWAWCSSGPGTTRLPPPA